MTIYTIFIVVAQYTIAILDVLIDVTNANCMLILHVVSLNLHGVYMYNTYTCTKAEAHIYMYAMYNYTM